jgi:N-acetylmuramoyl-L-alanine amidase
VLELGRTATPEFEAFAPEGAGLPAARVIVLDPGHGGADAGVTVGGVAEKDLALQLAHSLAHELEQHLGARVVLTRTDDRAVSVEERAEAANRAHADLVLSLHFDGAPGTAAHGITAYCPPATYGATAAGAPQALELLPWRDVATRHAVRSRALAEAVLSELALRGLGPTRLRELLPYPLLGVNAPGLMLECGTLTSDADRARLLAPDGIDGLARAIASGIDAYRRAD